MPQVGRLVVKHLPVNGLAAAAVVVDDIAALDEHPLPNLKVAPGAVGGLIEQFHRSVVDIDGAVEAGALVVQPLAALVGDPLLAGAERAEVLGRLGHAVGEELEDDAAGDRRADLHLHPHVRVGGALLAANVDLAVEQLRGHLAQHGILRAALARLARAQLLPRLAHLAIGRLELGRLPQVDARPLKLRHRHQRLPATEEGLHVLLALSAERVR
mmetsp:Transcript_60243/g.178959  ORF Transcript_60243/g.178959 Transcript_60243/m.178959 type:complete len:214 (+) Transcript_60243:704-1345(+)